MHGLNAPPNNGCLILKHEETFALVLAGLGAALWRDITQVVFLDLNMRSAGALCCLLQQMRTGSITHDIWDRLQERVLRSTPEGQSDPRLELPPFSNNTVRCIVHRHALRAPLAYTMALRDSIRRSQLFYVLHACDEVQPADKETFDDAARRRVLGIANPRHTGRLPGILPLYVGMRLSLYNCKDCVRLGLMNGAEVEILKILFAKPEWENREPSLYPGDLNLLRYLPDALLLRAVSASWRLPASCCDPVLDPAGHTGAFLLKPISMTFNFKDKTMRDRGIRITRTMFPLLPSAACVVYGAQGESWPAVLADLACPPRMSPDVHWLANYVILSRARNLDGILLLRNATKQDLERGPPKYLVAEIDRLLCLEQTSMKRLQEELRRMEHRLPDEILKLFDNSLAADQFARHIACMSKPTLSNQSPANELHAPARRRLHGKQPALSMSSEEGLIPFLTFTSNVHLYRFVTAECVRALMFATLFANLVFPFSMYMGIF